jgi:hypothetical protein
MTFNREDPTTWPMLGPRIIAHDVGRSHDRSTAVVGGLAPFEPILLGVTEFEELPQGLFGSARASALASVDRRYHGEALIVADLSNDASYADNLQETFGPRVIGLQIGRYGDGMTFERRPVRHGAMLVYHIGRNYLLEHLRAEIASGQVRIVDTANSRIAFEQLVRLETRCGRAVQSTDAHRGSMTISASRLRCWCGRPGIRIWNTGSEWHMPCAGPAGNARVRAHWPGHELHRSGNALRTGLSNHGAAKTS